MAAFSDSYVLKVLLAPQTPARGLDVVARRARKMLDAYRPELYYMRGPGPKWREKYAHRTAGMLMGAPLRRSPRLALCSTAKTLASAVLAQ